ncbi:hypothetical protein AALP_AA2G163000 [Arabis alpina]|uniref:TIR domain-containing protein n=1 Tax=Arabis alpina TaxID=50452 RepID=A0A087HHV6_ARAAL|nr:hypothetical protein AALP_AA2G163000 [Arabis alpina]
MMASSSSSALIRNYDVFLSFRGEDTRNNIVSHLFEALHLRGFFTFIDNERIEAGDKISDRLTEAIKTSWFAVVVISENYATSKWCLEELRLIMELHSNNQIQVLPMFYRVKASDVRSQRGSFGYAFQSYEMEQPPDMRIAGWRGALTQLADLAGLHSTTWLPEADIIGTIVRKISNELQAMKPKDLINLVGMEAHMKTMTRLLQMDSEDEIRKIGVWGMGGVGSFLLKRKIPLQHPQWYSRISGDKG